MSNAAILMLLSKLREEAASRPDPSEELLATEFTLTFTYAEIQHVNAVLAFWAILGLVPQDPENLRLHTATVNKILAQILPAQEADQQRQREKAEEN